ncbi:MAG: FAD:protein FMN transferase [Chloroflexota bacterium]|nr:FAD:protein FMN transferase [Chloroflexota bacterium]
MNTDIKVVVYAADTQEAGAVLDSVEALFASSESTLSRFRADSELSAPNRSTGRPIAVSSVLFEVVREARDWAELSGGIFDPTILWALEAAGYDRSFELLEDRAAPATAPSWGADSWRDVQLNAESSTITLPPGCRLDLGGIGKGWTVDRAAELLSDYATYGIDAGGDIYLAGRLPSGEPWTVGVADPRSPDRNLATLTLEDQGVATSTTLRRRWRRGPVVAHYIIDPRTNQPARTDVVSATVVAGSVARAEVLAKTALILGSRQGLELLQGQEDASGLLVLGSGELLETSDLWEVLCA